MTITYYKSESTIKPSTVEFGKTTVYLHKNIAEVQRTDEMTGETQTFYEYDEAALTYAEYEQYTAEQRLNDIEDVLAEIIGGGEI